MERERAKAIDAFKEKARRDIAKFLNDYFDAAQRESNIPKRCVGIIVQNNEINDMMGEYSQNSFSVAVKIDSSLL